ARIRSESVSPLTAPPGRPVRITSPAGLGRTARFLRSPAGRRPPAASILSPVATPANATISLLFLLTRTAFIKESLTRGCSGGGRASHRPASPRGPGGCGGVDRAGHNGSHGFLQERDNWSRFGFLPAPTDAHECPSVSRASSCGSLQYIARQPLRAGSD